MRANGLATFVRERRQELGMTQVELADAVGVTHPAISDIERGKTKLPGAQVRRPLAKALGVSHLDLLVAAGELTREEAGEGTTPVSDKPAVEAICSALRRLDIPPPGLRAIAAAVRSYEAADRPAPVPTRQPVGTSASS